MPRYVNLHAVTTTAPAPEQPPEDGELLAKAAAGEREAFVAIYRRYHGRIYRFARSMTGSTAIAEDVTPAVFRGSSRERRTSSYPWRIRGGRSYRLSARPTKAVAKYAIHSMVRIAALLAGGVDDLHGFATSRRVDPHKTATRQHAAATRLL